MDLVVNVAHAPEVRDGHHLRWEWSYDVDWDSEVEMRMDADVAHRYLRGCSRGVHRSGRPGR